MKKKYFYWNSVSQHRTELLGVSALAIIIFHYCESAGSATVNTLPRLLKDLSILFNGTIGSMGVDIFVLLSGMGLYYSLSKNFSLIHFYKRRLSRIIPTYCILGGSYWIIIDMVFLKADFSQFLLDLFQISFWTQGNHDIWYIAFIIPMYIVYPLLFRMVTNDKKHRMKCCITLFYVAVICFIALYFTEFYQTVEIALTRGFSFIIGSFLAKYVIDQQAVAGVFPFLGIPLKLIFSLLRVIMPDSLFAFLYNSDLPFYRWTVAWMSIGVLLLISRGLELIESKSLHQFLFFTGQHSLEIYLSHVGLRVICNHLEISVWKPEVYLCIVTVAFILSIVTRYILKPYSQNRR